MNVDIEQEWKEEMHFELFIFGSSRIVSIPGTRQKQPSQTVERLLANATCSESPLRSPNSSMDADIFGRFASEVKRTRMLSAGVLLPSEEDGTMRLAYGKAGCLALPGGGGDGFFLAHGSRKQTRYQKSFATVLVL